MDEVLFFPARGLRAIVALFGLPVVLLLAPPHAMRGQQPSSVPELISQFENEKVFWRQIEIAKKIVAAHDSSVLPKLEP